jgi:hypothetical protein
LPESRARHSSIAARLEVQVRHPLGFLALASFVNGLGGDYLHVPTLLVSLAQTRLHRSLPLAAAAWASRFIVPESNRFPIAGRVPLSQAQLRRRRSRARGKACHFVPRSADSNELRRLFVPAWLARSKLGGWRQCSRYANVI